MAKQVDITYGNALLSLANDNGNVDALYEEVAELIKVISENDELIKLLCHPHINKEEKVEVVKNIFDGKISDELTGLIKMLVEKDHAGSIIDVFEYFIKQVKEEKGIGVVSVASAIELTDAQKKSVEDRIIATTSYNTLEVNYTVDKSLIGGLTIRINDRIVDSSIKAKLDKLSRSLVKG